MPQLYPSREERWVSCESFTFINQNYRTTMEEIKRATDLFLRDGITQFYNHGYFYSPEKEMAPSRDLIYMNRISHVNTWWPWYRGLADYQARAAFLCRQGRAEADVLVYSPTPTLWSERAEFPVKHVRDLPFGPLPKTLVANGYDFDCVNDDLLLNHAKVEGGKLVINDYNYSVLVLPRAFCLAPETLEKLAAFVESGGTAIALARLPEITPGLANHEKRDAALQKLRADCSPKKVARKPSARAQRIFPRMSRDSNTSRNGRPAPWSGSPPRPCRPPGRDSSTPCAPASPPTSKSRASRKATASPSATPAWAVWRSGSSPTSARTRSTPTSRSTAPARSSPQAWDALTGAITSAPGHRASPDGRLVLPVSMKPWASRFYLLAPAGSGDAPAAKNAAKAVATLKLNGPWKVEFKGLGGFNKQQTLDTLADWTTLPDLKNFSGNGTYACTFEISNLKSQLLLDLGTVHEVASVRINGQDAGKVWMQPYRIDVSKFIKPGKNTLEITVANSMWRIFAGLEQPTPIPAELRAHYGEKELPQYNAWEKFLQQRQREP